MDIIILIFAILAVVLLGVLILLTLRKKDAAVGDPSEAIEKLREEQRRADAELRQELGKTVQSSILTLGNMLQNQQKTGDEQLHTRLRNTEHMLKEQQEASQRLLGEKLTDMSKSLTERQQVLENTVKNQLDVMRQDNNQKLDAMQKVVDEKLQKTLEEKMTESFKQVSERLEQVYRGLGEMQTVAAGVGDLKKVLSNVKTRGILGEIQLGAILSEILAPEQYEVDIATVPKSTNRVEFAVKLPGANEGESVYLPIDSKFPGDTYAALQDAYESGDPDRVAAARKALATVVKKCAKDIRDKYVYPPATTNFAIMFLPFEGLYAEVVNSGLVEILQKEYQINITGPSTMAAMLNALQMGFRTLAIQKRTGEIWKILGEVKTEFETFESVLDTTQKHLKQAGDDLEKLVGVRTRQINRRLRGIETSVDET